MVHIRSVVERSQVYAEDAHGGDANGQGRDNPVDGGITCPTEPEHANRHKSRLYAREPESALWSAVDLVRIMSHCPFLLVNAEEGRDEPADTDGRKDIAGLFERKAVIDFEDERDRSELEIQDGPGEGNPQAEPENDRFREQQVDGTVQRHRNHSTERGSVFVCLDLPTNAAWDLPVLLQVEGVDLHAESASIFELLIPLVEYLCLFAQEDTATCFFEEDGDQGNHGGAGNDLDPEHPPPRQVLCHNTADQRAEAGSHHRCSSEENHGCISISCNPDIGQDASYHS